jgi:hypothetical protein
MVCACCGWINTFTTHPLAHAFLNSIVHQYFCVSSGEASAAEFVRCFSGGIDRPVECLIPRAAVSPFPRRTCRWSKITAATCG